MEKIEANEFSHPKVKHLSIDYSFYPCVSKLRKQKSDFMKLTDISKQ